MTSVAGDDLTLQQAAEELGVHYMTAYRYVRLGLLPAVKRGVIWSVARADLDSFRPPRAAAPVPGPGQSAAVKPVRGRPGVEWGQRLEARLVAGDGRGSWGVVEAAMAAGADLEAVYLDVLSPALVSIGERWHAGELDVATEHQASGIAARIVGRLGDRFARRGRTRGVVVLGTAPGERHGLAVTMLADLARSHGFEVVDLGVDLPAESFAKACAEVDRLVAVGISVMYEGQRDEVRATVRAVRDAVGPVPVFIGGAGIGDRNEALGMGADHYAADGREFARILEQLVV
jgi:excisionase family DNA binding protein